MGPGRRIPVWNRPGEVIFVTTGLVTLPGGPNVTSPASKPERGALAG
jgi:hypothetical protein